MDNVMRGYVPSSTSDSTNWHDPTTTMSAPLHATPTANQATLTTTLSTIPLIWTNGLTNQTLAMSSTMIAASALIGTMGI
jgi:hypothetical protein